VSNRILIIILCSIIGILLLRQNTSPTSSAHANFDLSTNTHQELRGYSLSPSESIVLDQVLSDDSEQFSHNQNSLLMDELLITTAPAVAKAYYDNQVAADQKYFNKKVYLSGQIQEINSGIGNEPYLVFFGVTLFNSPQARFQNNPVNTIAGLRKGQIVHLVCNGGGSIVGTPMFRDCLFAKDYAELRVSEIKEEISSFLRGDTKPSKTSGTGVLGIILIARSMPANSVCFIGHDKKKCLKDIKIAMNKFKAHDKQESIDLVKELEAVGVQFEKK